MLGITNRCNLSAVSAVPAKTLNAGKDLFSVAISGGWILQSFYDKTADISAAFCD